MSDSTCEKFLGDLTRAVDTTRRAIREMKDIIEKLEEHQKNVRISKTAGAVGGIVGTALMFTPIFYVGAAIIAGGAVTGIGAEIGDHVVNQQEAKKILGILEEISEHSERIYRHQENINYLAEELRKAEGLSEEDSFIAAWYWYGKKGIKGAKSTVKFVQNTKFAVQYIRASQVGRSALQVSQATRMSALIGKYAGTSAKDAYVAMKLVNVGFKSTAKAAAKRVVGPILDVITIVQTWSTTNPSLESAEEALRKLEMLESDFSRKKDSLNEDC